MRKIAFWLIPLFFLPTSCASKKAATSVPPSPPLEVVRGEMSKPTHLTRGHRGAYFVALAGKEQKSEIARVRKGGLEVLFTDLNQPGAITFDSRWGRLFVSDGGILRTYRPRKPKEEPKEIAVPEAKEISSISYSMMNGRAYFVDASQKRLWSFHPKKEEVTQLLGPGDFQKFGEGEPGCLEVSADGKRIYMILFRSATEEKSMQSMLATYHLPTQKLEKVHSFPGVELDGIEIYRSHFMLGDRATGEVYALSMQNKKVEKLSSPPFWKGPSVGFLMDLQQACFLVPEVGEEKGRLVRFNVHVKE